MKYRTWRKAELHCHLDGAIRPATADELARQQQLDLPRPLRLVAPPDCPSQAAYIAYFDDAIAVLQTAAALERAAFELGVDSAGENIDYLEVRWAPRLHVRGGLTVPEVITAVLGGLAAAPLRAVAIVCAMRQHSVEENIALAKEAGRFAGRGVVGFDLAGDEVRYSAAPQARAFEAARAAGLRLTCHAGEAGEPSSVEEALALGVERIAHGVLGARVPAIVQRIRTEGVVLDLCPTANWKCKAVAVWWYRDQLSLGTPPQSPALVMDPAMVAAAQQDQVVKQRRTAVRPMLDVMRVRPRRRPVATREPAALVPGR